MSAAAAVLVAALVVFAPTSRAGAVGTPPVTVMALGDSITRGVDNQTPVPWASQGGYRTLLWQRTVQQDRDNLDFVGSLSSGPAALGDQDHEGQSGWRIDEIQADVDSWMATYEPRIVLLHIGTNDILQNYDLADAPARLATLVGTICTDDPGVRIAIAQLIPRIGSDALVVAYNQAIPAALATLPASCAYQIVDMHPVVPKTLGVDFTSDGTHPTPAGYDLLANAWYPVLTTLYDQVTGVTQTPTPAPPSSPTASPTPSATPIPTPTPTVSPKPTPTPTPAAQAGLTAGYYPNTTLSGAPAVTEIDPQVHFSWGTTAPIRGLTASHFSVRWVGVLLPPRTGAYTIGAQSQNGVRVTLSGATSINDWTAHNSKWDTATVNLTAGQRVPVTIEYYASSGSAVMNLSWSGPGITWGTLAGTYLATR